MVVKITKSGAKYMMPPYTKAEELEFYRRVGVMRPVEARAGRANPEGVQEQADRPGQPEDQRPRSWGGAPPSDARRRSASPTTAAPAGLPPR